MEKTLRRLGGFREVPLDAASPFVRPASILFELDGALACAAPIGCMLPHAAVIASCC